MKCYEEICPIFDKLSVVLIRRESSDGTGAEIARPTAAAGGGVGAERAGSDGATSQSRGEDHK